MPSDISFSCQAQANEIPASTRFMPEEKFEAPTVLVVEDDLTMALFLMTCIGEVGGYQVVHAQNGRYAERILGTRNIGLIVSDIIMPDLDGLELIRIRDKVTPGTPIIIMTGGSAKLPLMDLPRTARMLGAEAALNKPVDPQKLLELIKSMVGKKSQS